MNLLRALILAATLAGCATLERPFSDHLESAAVPVRDCAAWFAALDAAVEGAGVRDAQEARIRGFPYLRVDRSLSALRERAAGDVAATQAFALRLAALDYSARKAEIANLPDERVAALPVMVMSSLRRDAVARTRDCAQLLRELDFAKPRGAPMAARARRGAGRLLDGAARGRAVRADAGPVRRRACGAGRRKRSAGVPRARRAARALPLIRYAPPPGAAAISRRASSACSRRRSANPLGMPEPAAQDLARAARRIRAELRDRGGRRLRPLRRAALAARRRRPDRRRRAAGGLCASALDALPGARAAAARLHDLVPGAAAEEPGDILAGRLDGITWRVTLAPDGEPLRLRHDPSLRLLPPVLSRPPRARRCARRRTVSTNGVLAAVSCRALPKASARCCASPAARITSSVCRSRGARQPGALRAAPYDELRSLQRLSGGARSAFGPDGLVPGTERPERFLFWPTGIALGRRDAPVGPARDRFRRPAPFRRRRPVREALQFDLPMTKKLRVATLNIHKGLSQFNRRMVIHELREGLRALKPDLVFLQEVQGVNQRHAQRFAAWPGQATARIPRRRRAGSTSTARNRGAPARALRQRGPVALPDRVATRTRTCRTIATSAAGCCIASSRCRAGGATCIASACTCRCTSAAAAASSTRSAARLEELAARDAADHRRRRFQRLAPARQPHPRKKPRHDRGLAGRARPRGSAPIRACCRCSASTASTCAASRC